MNEIESKFQDYINQLKSLQNSNYSVYEFYKKALQIENNFYKAVHDTDPDDYKGKYARCVILGKYKDFNCEGMLEQLNKLPESLKNENINSYYLRFPDKNISNQINKFIGDFSKLKNLSEEQAKNFYEKDCKEMLTNWDINENNYNPIVGNLFKITNPEKDGFSRY